MKIFVLLSFVVVGIAAVRFDGYQTYRITPTTEEELKLLRELEENHGDQLDFWRHPIRVSKSVEIMVPPHMTNDLVAFLDANGLSFVVGLEDIQSIIEKQAAVRSQGYTTLAKFDYNIYHTYEEISQWIEDFATENSGIVSTFTVGQSYQGRTIKGLKIGAGSGIKPGVYYQGGIHAREWISPATMINIIRQLVETYNSDISVYQLLNRFDYYIIPLLNVDGYAYTHQTGGNRLWRKNRTPNSGAFCRGTDLNRNYNYRWGGQGASTSPCQDTYRGSSAASELEIQASTNFLLNLKNSGVEFVSFIDFHAYSQLVLSPWSYSSLAPLPAEATDHNLAMSRAVSALEAVYGTSYIYGPSARTLYAASGCSVDWGYVTLGAKYSLCVELRDTGNYGFLLPENQIEPTGIETFELVKSFGETHMSEL